MISLKLTNTKEFMRHLLLSDTFDHFLFIEGKIVTFNTFTIDGYMQKKFFETEEHLPQYSFWSNIREYCFSIIKGKRTPLSFQFIFCLSPKNIARLIEQNQLDFQPESVQGLYLNLKYDGTSLSCVTGTSLHIFTMDKSLEQVWDKNVQKFFIQKKIAFEPEI
ncbi:hypothetical protein DWX08_09005 [Ruminococcus sp. AF18-22]|nr:hypothetical protein DWX08_09005 [Ruminococcus sp. AF18-22]